MPFATRPTFVDLDTCDVYRLNPVSRDSNGNYLAASWVKVHTGYKVNHHGTHNFDERMGGPRLPVILKKQNIMTADVFTYDIALGFQAQDVIKVTTRDSRVLWMTINGVADLRPASGYGTFYANPTNPIA